MNVQDLLDLMQNVRDTYIAEALEGAARQPRRRLRPMTLVAAVLAVMLLLAGCVAVYLRIQDMAIGREPYVQQYDKNGLAVEPTERVWQVTNFSGCANSPAQLASREWYEFCESYDPEHKLMTNEPDIPEIPNNYEYCYGCYTQDMADRLTHIAEKYQLNLLGLWVPIQRYQSDIALEGLGASSLLKSGAEAELEGLTGMLFPPYNFDLEFDLKLTGEDALWKKTLYGDAEYHRKDYLPDKGLWRIDVEAFDQWNYTTADGITLLIAYNKTSGSAFLVAEQENAFYTIHLRSNTTGERYPAPDTLITREAVEQVAELIDFSLIPGVIDPEALEPKLQAAEAEHQAATAYVPPVYGSFVEFFKESAWLWQGEAQYTFYDINEDGQEELLIGYDGMVSYWYDIADGQVQEHMLLEGYLCEGNILEGVDTSFEYSSFLRYTYLPLEKGIPSDSGTADMLTFYLGKWYYSKEHLWLEEFKTHPTISEAEARAIREKHPHLDLKWVSVRSYPLDDAGQTLGDYIRQKDVPLGDVELREAYKALVLRRPDGYTHYRILDLNGDGVDDLLLSGNGEYYWGAYTYRFGQIQHLFAGGSFYLCEDGVLGRETLRHEYPAIEIQEHVFLKLEGFRWKHLDYAAYDRSTASWMGDYDFTPMSETEAQAVLAKYPKADQGMKPISELTGD